MSPLDNLTDIASAIAGGQVLPTVRYSFELLDSDETGWRVRRLELREALSEPYECILELACDLWIGNSASLEGASCIVKIVRDHAERRLCGIVTRVERLGTMIDHLLARVHVRPALAALGQRRDSRVFQGQTVPQILESVLADGLEPYERSVRLDCDRTYEPREYCVQYAESDLDFVRRLMSEEGMFSYFEHSGDREVLVLTDFDTRCPRYEPESGVAVPIAGPESPQELIPHETLRRLEVGRETRSTSVVLRDFDWTRPALDLTCKEGGPDEKGKDREVYDYPSSQSLLGYDSGQKAYSGDEGAIWARLRREELQCGTRFAVGESNVTGLGAGMVLEVDDKALSALGTRYLVTRIEHEGAAEEEIQHQKADSGTLRRYQNRFTCASHELPYRPPVLPRPVMPGPQTATVVGPAGEEIHTDEHGRIKVQFHWDRLGANDDHSSCWIRVAQAWSGPGWGFLFLPRIGMEVVVQFLDGNPDRPLVTGCVYNGLNAPPYDLPSEKTKSTIKTSSSPGGDGSNELRFEDAAGSEEIYLHAQKVLTEVVEQNHSMSVGGDQSISVTGNQSVTVKGGGGSPVHSTVNVTGKHQLDASDTIEVQAPTHIKLTCGGSSILIEPGKISIEAGDGSKVVLDANGLYQSSQGSKVFLDANALTESSAGAKSLHDANVLVQSVAGSKVVLDANALTQSSAGAKTLHDANVLAQAVPGASLTLDANATMAAPANATVQAGAAATVTSPTSTLAGGGGAVVAGGPGVTAAGGKVDVSGGMVNVSGGLVKIN